MKLTFLGAAGEVTGSCYLVETGEVKFLLECGKFQSPPRQTWAVHGEPLAAGALRDEIRRKCWNAQVPSPAQTIEIA